MNEKPTDLLRKMLASPDCRASDIRDPNEILGQLARRVFAANPPTQQQWRANMADYVRRMMETDPSFTTPSSERGNLNRAFTNPYLTIRSFIRAMDFHKIRNFRLELIAEDRNGKIIHVSSDTVRFTEETSVTSADEHEEVENEVRRANQARPNPQASDVIPQYDGEDDDA